MFYELYKFANCDRVSCYRVGDLAVLCMVGCCRVGVLRNFRGAGWKNQERRKKKKERRRERKRKREEGKGRKRGRG